MSMVTAYYSAARCSWLPSWSPTPSSSSVPKALGNLELVDELAGGGVCVVAHGRQLVAVQVGVDHGGGVGRLGLGRVLLW